MYQISTLLCSFGNHLLSIVHPSSINVFFREKVTDVFIVRGFLSKKEKKKKRKYSLYVIFKTKSFKQKKKIHQRYKAESFNSEIYAKYEKIFQFLISLNWHLLFDRIRIFYFKKQKMFQEHFLTVLFGAVMSITVPSTGFSPERSGNIFKKKEMLFFKVNGDIWNNICGIFLVIFSILK